MKAYLIQIDAWSGSTAAPVRLASHNDERLCHLDGKTWWPAIAALPTLRYDFFDGAFDAGSITSPSGDMSVAFNAIPSLPALSLHDTRIRIWRGELGDAWGGFSLMFDGRVQEQPSTTEGIASLKFGVDDSWLDQPLLATYGGTGGADGPPDIQGEVKPLALGAPRFAPAVLVDAVDNIYELSGYGAINAVEMAFERLNRFGASSGNAANFASLKAADIAPGAWATCLSGGYVRFGAPPDGLLSFHVQGDAVGGWSRKPGDIIARIATIGGGAGKFSASDMTALNASRPWNLSVMVTAQTTARELIQRIAASVNAVAFVDWLGQLRVAPIGIGTASLTLASDGSALPPVASVEQVAVAAPYWKLAQGAAVTWQVHGLNDIAFNAPLNPRGPYDPAETYREGDMVTLPNGSQWLFIGTTPATGSTPGPGNANWYRLADDITAGNITYEDGTPVEELKPAEPGATNGAPEGTPVGEGTAKDVIDALKALGGPTATAGDIVSAARALVDRAMQSSLAALGAQLLGEERKARWERLTHLDGAELTTRVHQEIRERIEGDTAIVERVDEIEATATDGISAAMAAISLEQIVRASADEAETLARETAISLVQTDVADVQAAIVTEASTRASADAAEASLRQALAASVASDIADVNAAILDEASVRATADTAEATARQALAATLTGNIGDVSAAVIAEQTARVSADAALASDISSVETTMNGHTASITQVSQSIDGVLAKYGLRLSAGNKIIGILGNNDSVVGGFDVVADYFRIWDPDDEAGYTIFAVEDGAVYIRKAIIKDATIDTLKIADHAVTQPYFASLASDQALVSTVETPILSLAITKAISDSVVDIEANLRFYSTDDIRATAFLYDGSTQLDSINIYVNGAGKLLHLPVSLSFVDNRTGTGSRSYTIKVVRDGGASNVTVRAQSNLNIVEMKR
jgi:hypothetical protein